jgi:RNA polymerase sigma factor (sigma-70 family)
MRRRGVLVVVLTMSDGAGDEDEDELLAQLAGGDMRALEALYRRMRVQVFGVALAVAGDRATAEDVVQDTFVRVYSAASQYRPGSRARAWVLTIARHLALDAVRRRAREPVSGIAGGAAAAPDGPPDGIRLDVVNALLRLGEVDRQIVVLHDMAGLTHAEVAAELQLPAGTVRWRYRVALARLRPLVAEVVS